MFRADRLPIAAAAPARALALCGIVLLTLLMPRTGRAAQVTYPPDVPVSGSTRVSWLRDPSGGLSLWQVRAMTARFRPEQAPTVNFGFSSATYWLHLSVQSHASAPTTVYLAIAQPALEQATLYVLEHDRLVQSERAGEAVPLAQRAVPVGQPVLPLRLAPGQPYELFLRVASARGALLLPLTFESGADLERSTRGALLINAFFSGLVAALFLYNLFLWLSLRQRAYLYYVLLLPFGYLSLIMQDGFGPWVLFPGSHWLVQHGTALFASLGLLCVMQFARALLDTASIRWLDRLLSAAAGLGALGAVCALAAPRFAPPDMSYRLVLAGLFIAPLLGALAGLTSLLRGHPQARFYVLAQLASWAATLNFAVRLLGLLPAGPATGLALLVGGSAQALLYSLALADRIRALQRATSRAESAARQVLETRQQELERSVEERTRELDEARRRAEHLASIDALTGVYNRRGLLPLIQQAVARAAQHGSPLSLIAFDLDHFKQVNDEFGHAEGDRVLCRLVTLTRQLVRTSDLFGRTGGEEFMLMVLAPREQALQLAERLRAHLERQLRAGSEQRVVTASFGVVALSRRVATLEGLQLAADAALYRAKNHGRNRVETFDPTSNETTRTRAIFSPTGEDDAEVIAQSAAGDSM